MAWSTLWLYYNTTKPGKPGGQGGRRGRANAGEMDGEGGVSIPGIRKFSRPNLNLAKPIVYACPKNGLLDHRLQA